MDKKRPGFVKFDLSEYMEDLENNPGYDFVFEKFQNDLCDWNNSYLRRTSVKAWFSDMIDYVLKKYSHGAYELYYDKRGLAHTIKATERKYPHNKISIDFVPAFKLENVKNMHYRSYPPYSSKQIYNRFYAVPKPFGGSNTYSFQMVNPVAERKLLWNKQNLKIVFRLMKSFRNCYGLQRIKSYFLTTVFLWQIRRRKTNFWKRPVAEIFVHVGLPFN